MAFDPGPTDPNPKWMLSHAKEYLLAAECLIKNNQGMRPDGPLYFLICHAFELTAKAYLVHMGLSHNDLRSAKYGHKIAKIMNKCYDFGINKTYDLEAITEIAHNLNVYHRLRYPLLGLFKIGASTHAHPSDLFFHVNAFHEQILFLINDNHGVKVA